MICPPSFYLKPIPLFHHSFPFSLYFPTTSLLLHHHFYSHCVISISFQRNHKLFHFNNPPLTHMFLQLWLRISAPLGKNPLEELFIFCISSYSPFVLPGTSSCQALFPLTSQKLFLSWSLMTLKLSSSKVNLSLHFILTTSNICCSSSFLPS